MTHCDVILVGGGLANGLIASRLAALRPQLKVLIVEAAARLGGNHTWCFHATDVTPHQDQWLGRFTAASWVDQQVQFPAFRRRMPTGYRALTPDRLFDHVAACPSVTTRLGARVTTVGQTSVTLDGGETLTAPCVIDGRGLQRVAGAAIGYQKFVGLEVELAAPHGLDCPIIMDATVPQIDGYRFMYCLPFSPMRLLVEDTYYSDGRALDVDVLTTRVRAYAQAAGWTISEVVRVETGVLPIVLDGSIEAFWPKSEARMARAGMRAGLFHQTTGYSLPLAASVADEIAGLDALTTAVVAGRVRAIAARAWERQGFFRLLNRLLFISAEPDERVDVMQRFYRLSAPLVERFYAGQLTAYDKARILSGRPPIPVVRALRGLGPWSARDRRVGQEAPPPPRPIAPTGPDHG